MPLKPSVTDCAEVVIRAHHLSNNGTYVTTLGMYKAGMTLADLTTCASAIVASLVSDAGLFSANVYFDSVDVKSVDQSNLIGVSLPAGIQGSLGGTADSPAKAKVFTLKTATAERYSSGRCYLGGWVTADQAAPQDNSFIPSRIAFHEPALAHWGAAINTAGVWSVISYKKTTHYAITSIATANNKINFRKQRSEAN